MVIFSQCMDCKNFIEKNNSGVFICKAFPEGIPDEVLWNKIDHSQKIDGDHGFQYEEVKH